MGGQMWSKTGVPTNDFEVSFSFSSKSPAVRSTSGEGFAFWYVYGNATQELQAVMATQMQNQNALVGNWLAEVENAGFNLFGYKGKFDGLGVFFCDGPETSKPMVSAIVGDGEKQWVYGNGVPAANSLQYNFRNGQKLTVTVKVKSTKVEVSIGGNTMEVQAPMKAGGFIGLTSFGGRADRTASVMGASDTLTFHGISTTSMDATVGTGSGSDVRDSEPLFQHTKGLGKGVMEKTSSHADHRTESAVIKNLTAMVFKLIVESVPARRAIGQAIGSLDRRITDMEEALSALDTELDKKSPEKVRALYGQLNSDLTSISRETQQNTAQSVGKLDNIFTSIHRAKREAKRDTLVKHIDRISDAGDRALNSVNNEHHKVYGVSLAMILFIVGSGVRLYLKFKSWEKKHVL